MTKDRRRDKGRCTGACCERFFLPATPDELWAAYHRWEKGGAQVQMNGAPELPVLKDIHLIAPMVIPLEVVGDRPPQGLYVNETDEELLGEPQPWRGRGWYYTCKRHVNGACSIYEHRPSMCRDYPYSRPCLYSECSWGARREAPETIKEREARRERLLAERAAKRDAGGEKT